MFLSPFFARHSVQHRLQYAAVVLLMLGGSPSVNAEVIGLFSTGVDDDGNLLAPGTIDPHYTVTLAPSSMDLATTNAIATLSPGWMAPPPAGSRFLGTGVDASNTPAATPSGDYIFETTFEISADPADVVLTGSIVVDDNLSAEVWINGTQALDSGAQFNLAEDFNITSADANFLLGTNTLELRWSNTGDNVGGIAFGVTGSVVPEPSSFAFLGLIGVAGAVRYRRRQNSSKA